MGDTTETNPKEMTVLPALNVKSKKKNPTPIVTSGSPFTHLKLYTHMYKDLMDEYLIL